MEDQPERLLAVVATVAGFVAASNGAGIVHRPAWHGGHALHDACVVYCNQIDFIIDEEHCPLNGAHLRHPGAFLAGQLTDLAALITRVYEQPPPPTVAFLVVKYLLERCSYRLLRNTEACEDPFLNESSEADRAEIDLRRQAFERQLTADQDNLLALRTLIRSAWGRHP
jgi:hypothetical protein